MTQLPGPRPSLTRESEARLRRVIECNADGALVVTRAGDILFANPAAGVLLDRPAERLAGQKFGIPIIPGETTELDVPYRGHAGRVVEMRVVDLDWEGQPAFLASLRDISVRKRAEATLRLLAQAGSVFAASLDVPTTLDSLVRLAVPHLADWCLVDRPETSTGTETTPPRGRFAGGHAQPWGQALVDRLVAAGPPDLGLDPSGPLGQVLQNGRPALYSEAPSGLLDALAPPPDGPDLLRRLGCHSAMVVPLPARGRTLGVLTLVSARTGHAFDADDLELAAELAFLAGLALDNARLYDASREAVRQRDEFLAMLAHELRNPLTSILHAAHLVGRPGADPAARAEAPRIIERQARQMGRLLDDLLDVSRLTQGKIRLRPERFDLLATLRAAVRAAAGAAQARSHTLNACLPDGPLPVEGDPVRLDQVFSNLLHNAVKYTPPGGRIDLTATSEGGHAVVRVRDNGVGIPPELLPRVFEPFVQLDHTLDRSQGGLGVGLTLVRRLVELQGGQVAAHSDGPGMGSEFVVRLPLAAALAPANAVAAAPQAPPRRVVLVEDGDDAREMLAQLLELFGHQTACAADGRAALDLIARFQPDVALVDIGLPEMSGYEVAEAVRARPGGDDVCLVALTGYSQEADRARAFRAGFDAFLVKPVDPTSLDRLLRQPDLPRDGRAARPGPPPHPALPD